MSLGQATWQGRRKRLARRFAHDIRLILPLIGLGLCLALSATAIAVTDGRIPVARSLSEIVSSTSMTDQATRTERIAADESRDFVAKATRSACEAESTADVEAN